MTGRNQRPEGVFYPSEGAAAIGVAPRMGAEPKDPRAGERTILRARDPREQSRRDESGIQEIIVPALFTFVILFCLLQICWMVLHRSPAESPLPKVQSGISAFAG